MKYYKILTARKFQAEIPNSNEMQHKKLIGDFRGASKIYNEAFWRK